MQPTNFVVFSSELEAQLVAEQLYNCQVEGNILKFPKQEKLAVDLAISLANILIIGAQCQLPFPRHERECKDDDAPQIYVACLSAYNSGMLHGIWIDCTQDVEAVREDIEWMLSWSPCRDDEPCEEYTIHDYQNWHGIYINEYEDIEKLAELAQMLSEHGKAYAAYYNYDSTSASIEDFQERYYGEYESEEDFVYTQLEEQGVLKKLEEMGIPSSYLNLEAIARDWFIDSYYSVEESYNKVYIFSRF
ncbi:antirestriction protein ArdA [Nostoc spongiaeforme FACHB-130]|uniref:Antirestriction protein ArdA n=1 Tax=Nostoc spongiaeforme FACHB-130 TaxID=1357510 RepID=A0ABR8FX94_9NOSO|nr:antirestriction protein ArdA [Nostoc spongiaeforme]MBD2596056.1 antirestriction protein ArdA [Nostoc spongiaeforme FACHB-130]